jgi:hypothetical protein
MKAVGSSSLKVDQRLLQCVSKTQRVRVGALLQGKP